MPVLNDIDVRGKCVFLRVDFNVPFDKGGAISDDSRIKAALPTIKYLLDRGARVIAASHLGRPKGRFDPLFSLKPVAERLAELIPQKVIMAPDVIGARVDELKDGLDPGQLLLLENLRFYAEEKSNDEDFARKLADGIDVYINDAFGVCHRAHASVVAVTRFVPRAGAGFLIEKELEYLDQAVHNPKKPYCAILGGAKVSDKIPVITNLIPKADSILIGGAMAYTFFAAQGLGVGRSRVETEQLELALSLIKEAERQGTAFELPLDHIAAAAIDAEAPEQTVNGLPIPDELMGLDIGLRTISRFAGIIAQARTIFWNGPMGVFEIDKFAHGTMEIAKAVARSKAVSIIGGGDSVAAVTKSGIAEQISHISTGGGASLEYIANETLPGLEALREKQHGTHK